MENILEILLTIYSIVVFVAIIVYPFIVHTERLETKESNSPVKEEPWKRRLHMLLESLVIIVIILLFLFILKKKYVWLLVPITMLNLLERTNEVYASLTIVKESINKKGSEALSKGETDAIIMLATALMMFNLLKIPQKILNYVMEISEGIISDWVATIVLAMIVTLYCFLIGVLLLIPIKGTIRLVRCIIPKMPLEKIRSIGKVYEEIRYQLDSREFISVDFVEWTIKKKKAMRIMWFFLLILIPIDIFTKIVGVILNIIMTVGLYIYLIMYRIKNSIVCLVNWFEQISERKMINVIFRSAFILSISIIVIANRYNPFLHYDEAGTGVLEFIASAIVIPMIFTWIIDYKASASAEK